MKRDNMKNNRVILFLDIDDTLYNSKTIYAELNIIREMGIEPHHYKPGESGINKLLYISRYGLDMLTKVVSVFKITDIVISSSWRLSHSLDYIKLLFYYRGYINLAKMIIDSTPIISEDNSCEILRKKEIEAYVKEHSIEHYYILDDMFIDIPGHYLVNTIGWGDKTDLSNLPDFEVLK